MGDIIFASKDQLEEGSYFKRIVGDVLKWVTGYES